MERANRQQQLWDLIDAMNLALDQGRWQKLPAQHQYLMRLFYEYEAFETDADALRVVKDRLRDAFAALIERRTKRADELKAKVENHNKNQEGMLAYSMVNLFSEQS